MPYISQFIMAARLDATAIGSFGLILAFCGPISLLMYSLQSVVFPVMVGGGKALEDLIWSWKGLSVILCSILALIVGGAIVGQGLDFFYGHKYQGIATAFMIYFAGFSITSMVGLYSISQHTQGVPQYSNAINLIRVVTLTLLLSKFGTDLNSVILITVLTMCVGEFVLAALLGFRRRRVRA